MLRGAAAFTIGAQRSLPSFADAAMLPPLCELRRLLRVCSNPQCAVLPQQGQTAAEEPEAGPGTRMELCAGGCGVVCYCCGGCRKEHGLARDGAACSGGASPAQRREL